MFLFLFLTTAFAQDLSHMESLEIPSNSSLMSEHGRPPPRSLGGEQHWIVNGSTTSDYEAVGTFVGEYSDGLVHSFCTGTLVTGDLVLTAAHCIESMYEMVEDSSVMGLYFLLGSDKADGVITGRGLAAAEMHPEYNTDTLENDVGLVQLSEPLSTSPTMCISPFDIDDTWQDVVVDWVGFGMTGSEAYDSGVKRTLSQPIIGMFPFAFLTARQDTNICGGDSGGAAVVEMSDGTRMLAGVTSFTVQLNEGGSSACEADGVVSGAARLDVYRDWVQGYTGDILCDPASGAELPRLGAGPTGPSSECDDDEDGYESDLCGGLDCDDSDPFTNPSQIDSYMDGVDQDCDGIDGPEEVECDIGSFWNGEECLEEGSGDEGGPWPLESDSEEKAGGCSVTGTSGGFMLSLLSMLGMIRRRQV